MVDTDDGKASESRLPTLSDLLALCHALNNAGAKYIVVGGMAIIEAGFVPRKIETKTETLAILRDRATMMAS
jgi:hypothetical protein